MKTKYSSSPSNTSAYKAGALLIAVGYIISLLLVLKGIYRSWADLINTANVGLLLDYAMVILGAFMLFKNSKYGFKFPLLLVILGSLLCGINKAIVLCLILVLISQFAFSFNVKFKYWKRTKTPWICLLSAALSIIIGLTELGGLSKSHSVIQIVQCLARIAIVAGVFMISFFTEAKEDENLKNIEIGKADFSNRNIGHIIGVVLIAVDFVFVLLANLDAASETYSIFAGIVNIWIPLIAYLAAVYMLANKAHKRKGWVVAILLMAVYQYSSSLEGMSPVMPTAVFLFIFVLTAGFEGNYVLGNADKKTGFTAFKIVAAIALLLCVVIRIREIAELVSDFSAHNALLEELKEKAAYPFDASYQTWIEDSRKSLIPYFAGLFRTMGLLLIVTCSEMVREEAVAVKVLAGWFGKAEDAIRNFFNNVGCRIRGFAKIIAKIILAIGLICLTLTGVAVVVFALFKLSGNPAVAGIPMSSVMVIILVGVGIAITCVIFAIPFWFVYAFGQITSDVTEINEETVLRSGQNFNTGEGYDDLPEL